MMITVRLPAAVGITLGAWMTCLYSPVLKAERETLRRGDSNPKVIKHTPLGVFGSDYVRLGDLNGDGMLEVLCIQAYAPGNPPGYQGGEHVSVITCLTAIDLDGRVLWQVGKPDLKNLYCGGDHPVQIYDWNGDGRNEVIYIPDRNNVLTVLNGATGEVLKAEKICGGHDSLLFADFSGKGAALDLMVKDRYENFWVFDRNLKLLWSAPNCNPGHYPMEYDVDGDGKTELMCGYSLYSHDGRVLWRRSELGGHCDAVYIDDMDGDGRAEIAIAASHGEVSEQATLLDANGKVLWRKVCDHCQFALIGRFRPDLPGKQVCFVDRQIYRFPDGHRDAEVAIYTQGGEKLLGLQLNAGDTSGAMRIDRWTSDPNENVLGIHSMMYAPPCLIDGRGRRIAVFPFPEAIEKKAAGSGGADEYGALTFLHVDCYGDEREEIFLINHRALYVWTNASGGAAASQPQWSRDLRRQSPRFFNSTSYSGRG